MRFVPFMTVHRIGTVNVCGLRRKIRNINHLLRDKNVAILAMQETKINIDFQLYFNGYNIYRKDHNSRSKGVAIAVIAAIPSRPHPQPSPLDQLHAVATDIFTPAGLITTIAYYNTPQENLNRELFHYADDLSSAIIMGDFNARSDYLSDRIPSHNGEILEDILLGTVLTHAYNEEPTFIGHGLSIPDHILYSPSLAPFFADHTFLGPTVSSDHTPLLLDCTAIEYEEPITIIKIKDFINANWTAIARILDDLPSAADCSTIEDIDAYLVNFNATIKRAIQELVPEKTIDITRPTLPPEIVRLIKEKRKLRRQYIRTRDTYVKNNINRLQALIRKRTDQHHERRFNDAVSSLDYKNAANFWKLVNRLTRRKTSGHIQLTIDGTITTDPQRIAEQFAATTAAASNTTFPTTPDQARIDTTTTLLLNVATEQDESSPLTAPFQKSRLPVRLP